MNSPRSPLKLFSVLLTIVFLVGCGAPAATPATATITQAPFPLSEPGPYFAGVREYSIVDESRDDRKIRLTIWYPALEHLNEQGEAISRDAPPDMSGAPYPLVLTGTNSGTFIFRSHLASHGYVMVIVHSPYVAEYQWNIDMVDNAYDLLFTLDQLATNPPEEQKGIIDADNAGVVGYSGDGNTSFAVSGARLDPEFYRSQCEQVPVLYPTIFYFWSDYACSLTEDWEAFAASVGNSITESDDGLWQPITDERIRAVVAMAATSPWLYGERGLAAVDRPVLIIGPSEDELDPHAMVTDIFEGIGNPDKVMITFIGKGHMMVEEEEVIRRMGHFAVAFFGYHLQGREDLARYFSEEFVAQYNDLAWGVYKK